MKVMVSSGDKHVQVWVKGSGAKELRRAQKTAEKLLAKAAAPVKEKNPIGFAAPKDVE
jgi:hypothetical protein